MREVEKRACAWILSDDTGLSSKTMWSVMMDVPQKRRDYPHDPADLLRCLRLLEVVPEWRRRLHEMVLCGPEWAALIERWAEIEVACLREVGLRPARGASAPYTYKVMREVIDAAQQANKEA